MLAKPHSCRRLTNKGVEFEVEAEEKIAATIRTTVYWGEFGHFWGEFGHSKFLISF